MREILKSGSVRGVEALLYGRILWHSLIERREQRGIQSMPTQKVHITSTRLFNNQICLKVRLSPSPSHLYAERSGQIKIVLLLKTAITSSFIRIFGMNTLTRDLYEYKRTTIDMERYPIDLTINSHTVAWGIDVNMMRFKRSLCFFFLMQEQNFVIESIKNHPTEQLLIKLELITFL